MIDAHGRVQKVLLVGGTSTIGVATVREIATRHALTNIVLAGRAGVALTTAVADLQATIPTARVSSVELDLTEPSTAVSAARALVATSEFDVVILSAGVLIDNEAAGVDPMRGVDMALVNYVSQVAVGSVVLDAMQRQGFGVLVVVSSVAGERTRADNFSYGATKAALDSWASGAADSVAGGPVRILIVRPGMVRTRMSAGLPPAPMTVGPDAVADAIADNLMRGPTVVWVPGALRWVMSALRHLPRPLFRRVSRRRPLR